MNLLRGYSIELVLMVILVAAVGFFAYLGSGLLQSVNSAQEFSGQRALERANQQLAFGPRVTGTQASKETGEWLTEELQRLKWDVVIEQFTLTETITATNYIAIRSPAKPDASTLILGAHYDSRLAADADPDAANHLLPPPGANSGASGPALLLELARTLDIEATGHTVCLVFFDAEDNGGLPGWEANMGSRYFLERLAEVERCVAPRLAVIFDLVGNGNQQIYIEQTSDAGVSEAIWQAAAQLGYGDRLRDQRKWAFPGTQTVFAGAGIRAAIVADFDYPYRYTLADTQAKLSAESFNAVGRSLESWLESGAPLDEAGGG